VNLLSQSDENRRGARLDDPLLNRNLKKDGTIPEVDLPLPGKKLANPTRLKFLDERVACGIGIKVTELSTEEEGCLFKIAVVEVPVEIIRRLSRFRFQKVGIEEGLAGTRGKAEKKKGERKEIEKVRQGVSAGKAGQKAHNSKKS
jgi:hypothetical protein